jgi:hypothetical protein
MQTTWAISCHIAGKALQGDANHVRWLLAVAPSVSRADRPTLPGLAKAIDPYVAIVLEDPALDIGTEPLDLPEDPFRVIQIIEQRLHAFIRNLLVEHYGDGEEAWWRKGIPLEVRKKCVSRREDDATPQEAYSYVDFIDLKDIVDKQWSVFESNLLTVSRGHLSNKRQWMSQLNLLNDLRNRLAHAVRRYNPDEHDRDLITEFFELTRTLIKEQMRPLTERLPRSAGEDSSQT